jgi:long-chain acyl-CoA synthetase
MDQNPFSDGVDMNETLPRMVLNQAERLAGRTALRRKVEGVWRDISWQDLDNNIRAFGEGLLGLGIRAGDRVAVMAPNSPEWVYADLGSMACGALSVPVYHTEGVGTLLHILQDSQSRFLFIHSPLIAGELLDHLGKLPHLETIIQLEGPVVGERCLRLETFLQQREVAATAELAHRLATAKPGDVATLVYTSGTTGPPKGVMLTHANFLSNVEACSNLFPIGPADQCLSFLPLSHVFERMAGYYFMLNQGAVIAYAENFDSVPANLAEVRPTVVISVPRLYEKMYARVLERVLAGPWLKKQLFFGALKAGRALVESEMSGEPAGVLLQKTATLARKVVFAPLREHLGGRLRFFVSGGAPLGRDIAEFFFAVGLPIYEGYGLTETSPVIAANTPQHVRLGTVGLPIPGTEVRIADDGEILARGPGVFQGYWNQPEQTAAVFDDGWFRTGDIGQLDADGFLAITDRKKDLIVTAGGENVAPQVLENGIKTDKFITNVLVYGDRKPFLTALIVPNFDNIEKFAREHRIDFLNHCDLVNHPQVLRLIRDRIDLHQVSMPPILRIKRFTLISRDFSSSEGEVTPTLKVKRKVVARHFHRVLEEMYLPQDHGVHDSGFCIAEQEGETTGQ